MRVLTLPDKWEYPWFAAWDLAFQCLPLALVDPEFAKEQLWVLLFEQFMHANGQIPAYEWEFSDLNPPVHAWAVWRVYNMDRQRTGRGDRMFLEKCFHKLLINFAWWVNRVDAEGNNVFEGGFLGLDNITVVDRSQKMAPGMTLKQSDATGWMGMFCLNLMRIALELSRENQAYQGLATKFFEHFVYIGAAMRHMGKRDFELWSENDGFFYDVLRFPDGSFHKFRVRSLVGLIPMYAVDLLSEEELAPFPEFQANVEWFLRNRKELTRWCVRPMERDGKKSYLLSLMNETQMSQPAGPAVGPGRVPQPARPAQPVEVSPGESLRVHGSGGALRAGGVGVENQGRQFQLARPDLVSHVVSADRVAANAVGRLRLVVSRDARGGRGAGHAGRNGARVGDRPGFAVPARRQRPPAHL